MQNCFIFVHSSVQKRKDLRLIISLLPSQTPFQNSYLKQMNFPSERSFLPYDNWMMNKLVVKSHIMSCRIRNIASYKIMNIIIYISLMCKCICNIFNTKLLKK